MTDTPPQPGSVDDIKRQIKEAGFSTEDIGDLVSFLIALGISDAMKGLLDE